jgi:hypothetical protein
MIYAIVACSVLFFLVIILFYFYSELRVKSANESKILVIKYEAQLEDLRRVNDQILQEGNKGEDGAGEIQSLINEIQNLRHEKEHEIHLRLGAEKQIELTVLKTEEVEKRIKDWSDAQDAVMRDCMNSIYQVGEDLYQRLNKSYKLESEVSQSLIGKVTKNLSELASKTKVLASSLGRKTPTNQLESAPYIPKALSTISSIVKTFKSSGAVAGKDFFLSKTFSTKVAPLMLCELAVLRSDDLYLIDFKAIRYFEEYQKLQVQDQNLAIETLKQKLKKYFNYLSNPKYNQSILKALGTKKINYKTVSVALFAPSEDASTLLGELGYADSEFVIVTNNSINNIIT